MNDSEKLWPSVIIPAYNEEKTIRRIVEDISRIFSENYPKYEILVIDDKSKDRTLEICNEMKKDIKNLKVYSNEKNKGKTWTIINALKFTTFPIISFIDADYQYDPRNLPDVINGVINGLDLCTGKRQGRQDSWYRKFMSFSFNTFNRLMFGIKIDDVNCGLKAFRRDFFDSVNIDYLKAKWFIDTEILAKAYRKNMKIGQVGINHFHRAEGTSKVNCINLALETIVYGMILKLRFLFGRKWKAKKIKY